MYVIGRAMHEQLQIGNSVTIKVLRIGNRHVTLGIDAPKVMPLPRDETVPSAAAGTRPSGCDCDLKVLVVDDTPIHTWLVQKAFGAYGTGRTQVARSAKDALRLLGISGEAPKAGGCTYDLIVMEMKLPDMPGLELLRRVRSSRQWQIVPVVVMSYQDSDTEVAQCLRAGANVFVPKPETQEGFRQTILRIADFWSHARRVPAADPMRSTQESLVC